MDLGIQDKVALIVGASKNIGKSIAIELAKEGAEVWIVARNSKMLKETVSVMPGKKKGFLVQDLQIDNGPIKLIEKLKQKKIEPDIIVHNMGGSLGVKNPFCSREELREVWDFNLGISHEININLLPIMIDKKWGRCIHISTLSVKTNRGYMAYSSSKHALEGYVKNLSKEVSVNNVVIAGVAPGLVELEGRYFSNLKLTDPSKLQNYYAEHLPINRMVQPEEIASLVAFMCSEKSSYMAGSIVSIDGGG